MEITLTQCQFGVGDLPQLPGGKVLQFVDQKSGIRITIPLTAEAAKLISEQLTGLVIAHTIPHNGRA